jgi:hypothetical protein
MTVFVVGCRGPVPAGCRVDDALAVAAGEGCCGRTIRATLDDAPPKASPSPTPRTPQPPSRRSPPCWRVFRHSPLPAGGYALLRRRPYRLSLGPHYVGRKMSGRKHRSQPGQPEGPSPGPQGGRWVKINAHVDKVVAHLKEKPRRRRRLGSCSPAPSPPSASRRRHVDAFKKRWPAPDSTPTLAVGLCGGRWQWLNNRKLERRVARLQLIERALKAPTAKNPKVAWRCAVTSGLRSQGTTRARCG